MWCIATNGQCVSATNPHILAMHGDLSKVSGQKPIQQRAINLACAVAQIDKQREIEINGLDLEAGDFPNIERVVDENKVIVSIAVNPKYLSAAGELISAMGRDRCTLAVTRSKTGLLLEVFSDNETDVCDTHVVVMPMSPHCASRSERLNNTVTPFKAGESVTVKEHGTEPYIYIGLSPVDESKSFVCDIEGNAWDIQNDQLIAWKERP